MKDVLLFVIVSFFSGTTLVAQTKSNLSNDYRILLTDQTISTSENVETAWNALRIESNSMNVEGFVYAMVQHYDIPTKSEQEHMRVAGLNLIAYVPHYAWIAKIDPALTTVDLLNMNVRSVHKIQANMKMRKDMERGVVPSRAGIQKHYWPN